MSICGEINRIHVITISELADIFKKNNKNLMNDYKDVELYIDIDKTCMTPEKLLARAFNNNYALRNRIMLNTKRISFNYNDNLIPTRYNLDKFVNICKNTFKYIAYVTKRPYSEINKIREELSVHNLPTDVDIVNQNHIKENLFDNKFCYIDSDEDAYRDIIGNNNINNKSENSVLFQLSVF